MFNVKRPISRPLSFWTESDIWEYIREYNIPYSKIYDMGYNRTGCMFCAFGLQFEENDLFRKDRFETIRETHPAIYNYIMRKDGLNYEYILQYINKRGEINNGIIS